MAGDEVVDESPLGRLREEFEGFMKRTEEQISESDRVVKELQDQASSTKKRLEFLGSKYAELSKLPGIEAEISKMSKIEADILRINGEISKQKAEILNINADIWDNKSDLSKVNADIWNTNSDLSKIQEQQTTIEADIVAIRSIVDSFKFKKAVEEIKGYIDNMNATLVQLRGVVDRVDDMLNSILSFSVQMSFGNNFFSFIVQYHSTCGNWWMVFVMAAAFLSFLGFPLWINWGMLQNNFVVMEFHFNIAEKLRSKAQDIIDDNNMEDDDKKLELPSTVKIDEIKRKYVNKFVGIIMFVVIQCILVSVGSHFLFCGKSLSSGPLFSIAGLFNDDIAAQG